MKRVFITAALFLGCSITGQADVWRWVDAEGKTHFVDTLKPIYRWVDESGKTHYSDTPGHESAVSVEFVWHSAGTLNDLKAGAGSDAAGTVDTYPGETAQARAEREQAEAYYCKRATEIYESYVNAPKLYRTDEDGVREYLNAEEAALAIAETLAKKEEFCS